MDFDVLSSFAPSRFTPAGLHSPALLLLPSGGTKGRFPAGLWLFNSVIVTNLKAARKRSRFAFADSHETNVRVHLAPEKAEKKFDKAVLPANDANDKCSLDMSSNELCSHQQQTLPPLLCEECRSGAAVKREPIKAGDNWRNQCH
jgi:hypothetical protein